MATKYEQAVEGIDAGIVIGRRAVRVRDGNDTWLCPRTPGDRAAEAMDGQDAIEGDEGGMEAYSELCARTARGGLIVSLSGADRGSATERRDLVAAAVAEGLLDADEPLARRHLSAVVA